MPVPEVELKPLPPAEAIGYFQQKGYRLGFDYRDVWRQEHQAAFTVAKAMQMDLLQDIRGAVDGALKNGTTFQDFKKKLQPLLADKGWWGRKEMADPVTGEVKMVELGSPRRLQRIFDTNLATSYAEGQNERIERNKGLFGFLEYVRSASAHPRQSHLAYVGLVLPIGDGGEGDAFWARHMPVKEWGCKCTVIQHTGYSLERYGLKVGKPPAEVMRSYTNPRTGETTQVPAGVDPAFNYPLGGRRANLGRLLMEKAEGTDAAIAARVLAGDADTWAPLVQQEFSSFVDRYLAGQAAEAGSVRIAGALQPKVIEGLHAAGLAPARATIAVDLKQPQLQQLLADRDGQDLVRSVPELLRHVGEVWLDGDQVVLLSTPANDVGRAAKLVIDVAHAGNTRAPANAVRSLQLVDPREFDRSGLRRIAGE